MEHAFADLGDGDRSTTQPPMYTPSARSSSVSALPIARFGIVLFTQISTGGEPLAPSGSPAHIDALIVGVEVRPGGFARLEVEDAVVMNATSRQRRDNAVGDVVAGGIKVFSVVGLMGDGLQRAAAVRMSRRVQVAAWAKNGCVN